MIIPIRAFPAAACILLSFSVSILAVFEPQSSSVKSSREVKGDRAELDPGRTLSATILNLGRAFELPTGFSKCSRNDLRRLEKTRRWQFGVLSSLDVRVRSFYSCTGLDIVVVLASSLGTGAGYQAI